MIKWVLAIFSTTPSTSIGVGTRVRTKYGTGVITGGNVHIKYDDNNMLPKRVPKTSQTWSHNLNDLELL